MPADAYVCDGFFDAESGTVLSPKSQILCVKLPVDKSVNFTVSGAWPSESDAENAAASGAYTMVSAVRLVSGAPQAAWTTHLNRAALSAAWAVNEYAAAVAFVITLKSESPDAFFCHV